MEKAAICYQPLSSANGIIDTQIQTPTPHGEISVADSSPDLNISIIVSSPDDDPSSLNISHEDSSLTDSVDVDAIPQDVVSDNTSLNVPSDSLINDVQIKTPTTNPPHDVISVADSSPDPGISIIVSSSPDHKDASPMLSADDDPPLDISHEDPISD